MKWLLKMGQTWLPRSMYKARRRLELYSGGIAAVLTDDRAPPLRPGLWRPRRSAHGLLLLSYDFRAGCCGCWWLVAKSCLTLLRSNGRQPARLLCPWDFPGKNTGVGCHFLVQGIFSTQGLNLHLLHWQAGYQWAIGEALHLLWVDFQSPSCHPGLGACLPFLALYLDPKGCTPNLPREG